MQVFVLWGVGDTWTIREYSVHFDGIRQLQFPMATFVKAFGAWFATFWVFSVCYTSSLNRTCSFLEKYIFGLTCKTPVTARRVAEKVFKK